MQIHSRNVNRESRKSAVIRIISRRGIVRNSTMRLMGANNSVDGDPNAGCRPFQKYQVPWSFVFYESLRSDDPVNVQACRYISRLPRFSFEGDHVQLLIIVAPQRSIYQQWFWWPADPAQVALRAGDNLIWQRRLITKLEHRLESIVLSNSGWVMCSCTNCQCVTGTPINQRSIFIKWQIVLSLLARSACFVVISTAKPPPASLIQIWYHLTQERCFWKRDLQSSQEEAPDRGLHQGEDSWVGCHGAQDILVDTTYLPRFFCCQHCQPMAAHWSPA